MFPRDPRFTRALPLVLAHEGGFANHPRDPGGATMQGITQRVYDAWRQGRGLPSRSVRHLEPGERDTIYHDQYWSAVRADDLPDGLAYAVFDFAVNSGPARAARELQRVLRVDQDGVVGNVTLTAARERGDLTNLIREYQAARLAFVRRLATYDSFGRGWERRIAEVEAAAVRFATGATLPAPGAPAQGHAAGPDRPAASVSDALRTPAAWTGIGGAIGGVASMASGDGPVQWALAAALVLMTAAAVVMLVRRRAA
jgi:lysozyme family protein